MGQFQPPLTLGPALDTAPKQRIAFGAAAYLLAHFLHHAGSFLDVLRVRSVLRKAEAPIDLDPVDDEIIPSAFNWASSYVNGRECRHGR